MIKNSAIKRNVLFCLAVTGVYLLVNLILVFAHEQYFNEANQWQIAKHASLSELPDILKTEGHPILYYLLLMPLAKLGLPIIFANILSLLIMTLAVFLLVRYSPFKRATILLIIFSVGFMYYLPVFARNYCLVALSVVLVGVSYKNRLTHPIKYCLSLALLLQSHILAAGLVGALFCFFVIDYVKCARKKIKERARLRRFVIGVLVVLASLAILVYCLWGSTEAHGYLKPNLLPDDARHEDGIWEYLSALGQTIFGLYGIGMIILLLFLALSFYFLIQYTKILFIWLVAISFQACVLVMLYVFGRFTHDSLNVLYFILCFWITYYEEPSNGKWVKNIKKYLLKLEVSKLVKNVIRPNKDAVLGCICALTIPCVLAASFHDLTAEYSQAKSVATYVNKNLPAGSILVTAAEHENVIAIVPFLRDDILVYDMVQGKQLNYIIYDANSARKPSADEILRVMRGLSAKNVYFVTLAIYIDESTGIRREYGTAQVVDQLELVRDFKNTNVGAEYVSLPLEQYWALYKIPVR